MASTRPAHLNDGFGVGLDVSLSHIDIRFSLDIDRTCCKGDFRLRLDVHFFDFVQDLHADQSIEFPAFLEARDEAVAEKVAKDVLVDGPNGIVFQSIFKVNDLIYDLDADVEVKIAFLELV